MEYKYLTNNVLELVLRKGQVIEVKLPYSQEILYLMHDGSSDGKIIIQGRESILNMDLKLDPKIDFEESKFINRISIARIEKRILQTTLKVGQMIQIKIFGKSSEQILYVFNTKKCEGKISFQGDSNILNVNSPVLIKK